MQVFVKLLTGHTLTLEVEETDTITSFYEKIQDKNGIPPDQMRFIFAGKELKEGFTLKHYGLFEGCTIHAVIPLRRSP